MVEYRLKDTPKYSQFLHLVYYGEYLYVVFTYIYIYNSYLLSIKSGVLDITIGMIKKVNHFNNKTPSFYNMMYTQIFHKHIQQVFKKINNFAVQINY